METTLFQTMLKQWIPTPCPNSKWSIKKSDEADDLVDVEVKCTMNIINQSEVISIKRTVMDDESKIEESVVALNKHLFEIQDIKTYQITG